MRIKRFFNKIIKIFAYLPILWEDEDWDFEYLLVLIKYKLSRMRDTIHKNNFIAKYEQRDIFIGMNQVINHIDNYINDTESYKEINGDLPFKIGFRHKKLENGCYNLISWNEDENRQLNDEEEKIYTQYIINSNDWQQKEWEAIFDTIKKEGQKWWD